MGISENLILGQPKICRIIAVQFSFMAQFIAIEFVIKAPIMWLPLHEACNNYLRSSTKLDSEDNENSASLSKTTCTMQGVLIKFLMTSK